MFEDVILLIEGCIRGEERAWYTFAKEFGSMAENILRRFSDLSFQDRKDIIQNVFIRLLKGGLSKFQGSTKYEFFKYFKIIVINEGISYVKSKGRDKKDASLNGEVNGGNSEGPPLKLKDLIPNQDSRPDLVAEEREYLDRIKKVVEKFPLLDQQIFFMKINGYKDEEVKKFLNIPLGTVASKYSRIRSKVTEELGKG